MSFEGYTELLCVNGHHHAHDVYEAEPKRCPTCGETFAFHRLCDQTNGEVKRDQSTKPGKLKTIGPNRFAPGDKLWRKF